MIRTMHMRHWRPSAVVSCLAVAACAVTPGPSSTPPSAPAVLEPARLAQRGHGRNAAFEHCLGDTCPQRTPKTLLADPGPASTPAAFPPPAAGATASGLHQGSNERTVAVTLAREPSTPSTISQHTPVVQQLSVNFPFASARLDPAARAALREAAPGLAHAQEISLTGRTDSTGPVATNERLAQARAQAVLRELLNLAPDIASRVRVQAQGACCFVEPNDSAAGRATNRRVEIRSRFDIDDPP